MGASISQLGFFITNTHGSLFGWALTNTVLYLSTATKTTTTSSKN